MPRFCFLNVPPNTPVVTGTLHDQRPQEQREVWHSILNSAFLTTSMCVIYSIGLNIAVLFCTKVIA